MTLCSSVLMRSDPTTLTVCFPPALAGKVTPSPSLNVLVWPLTVTVTLELRFTFTPRTLTTWKYDPSSPSGFTPQALRWSAM